MCQLTLVTAHKMKYAILVVVLPQSYTQASCPTNLMHLVVADIFLAQGFSKSETLGLPYPLGILSFTQSLDAHRIIIMLFDPKDTQQLSQIA